MVKKLSDMYKGARNKLKGKIDHIQEEVEEKGGQKVATDLYKKGRNKALKTAFNITKAATSEGAKTAGKVGVGMLGGVKYTVSKKIGDWFENNYDLVIKNLDIAGLGDREKRGAKIGVVTANMLGRLKDSIINKIDKTKHTMEEKSKQFTLESAIPEVYVSIGLIDKFSKEEGTIDNRVYEMGDGIAYAIDKTPKTFEVKTNHPCGRGITIRYTRVKEGETDNLVEDTQFLLKDLALRIEEYSDETLKSFGETTRDIKVNSKKPGLVMGVHEKVYTSKFSKQNDKLRFEYALKKGTFEGKCSHVFFSGEGIEITKEEI